ncbi:MAG TPA: gluconate 2-dehydrogenase subunit 3 family protein [Candidatus Methylacidiphilales bacterium]|nr:gluconate 2-dehydrogenase subunit 3 family protein [Candidatus Methylacidiphilales bacterium]
MNQTRRDGRPTDPQTGERLPRTEQPGYYPRYSTLAQQGFWDAATRQKILDRVQKVPPLRFFTAEEARLMDILVDHLLPQDDRQASRRIPIVPAIDERLHEGRSPGYRFEKMPPDPDAYRLGFRALEQMAKHRWNRPFRELTWREQEELLKSIHDAKPKPGAEDVWQRMEIHRYWALLMQDCAEAYYAHPWAWDEIGFGGPAYPRGYMRLEHGEPEPWEVAEQRYEWVASADTLSDPEEREIAAHSGHPAAGQGGTH